MNLSPRLVPILSEAGLETLHWSSVGPPGAADTAIMAFARDHDWVVLAYDLDFSAILAATQGQPQGLLRQSAELFFLLFGHSFLLMESK